MPLKLQNVKFVDNSSKKLVSGYCRDTARKVKIDQIIPDLVLHICMLFYFQQEFIATIGEGDEEEDHNFEISEDKRTVGLIDGCWGTLYGNIIIDSLSQIICRWNIKILRKQKESRWNYASSLYIGLCGDVQSDTFLEYDFNLPYHSFCANGNGLMYSDSKLKANDERYTKWEENDMVGIKLDLKQRNVEYFVNDKSVGIIFKNVPIGENIKYRLAITMNQDGEKIQIDSFESL